MQRKYKIFLRDFIYVVLLNTVIATILSLSAELSVSGIGLKVFFPNFVFAHCIGLIIFFLIEVPRLYFWFQKPLPLVKFTFVLLWAIIVGYFLGNSLAFILLNVPRQYRTVFSEVNSFGVALSFLGSLLGIGGILYREHVTNANQKIQLNEKFLTEARLRLLQAQIEPHMLFNTLANIHSLIMTNPKKAQEMLEALIDFLRSSMPLGDYAQQFELIPIRQEFSLIENYLLLMKVRMDKRLEYRLILDKEVENYLIPPLILQPLVENAIKHGLEGKLSGGSICVTAKRNLDSLVIYVVDDGVGYQNGNADFTGVGLNNIRTRLMLVFGERVSIDIVANNPSGTKIAITINEAYTTFT